MGSILKHAAGWLGVLLLLWPALASAQEQAGQGTLTLIVRDPTGARLPAVSFRLIHDTDLEGRVTVGTYTTDATGTSQIADLPWGLYIVQFEGQSPDGRPILPATQQNLGLLEDGNGIDNGFGVRFAEPERTELFVLGRIAGEPAAVPMFDLAPHADAPPEPVDPLVAMLDPGPTAIPITLGEALAPVPPPSPARGRFDMAALWCLGLLLWVGALAVFLGAWRLREERTPPKGRQP